MTVSTHKSWFVCAVGYEISVILDFEDEFLTQEVHEVGHHLDDIGVKAPEEYGLYKWEGTITLDDGCNVFFERTDPDIQYDGKFTLLYSIQSDTPKQSNVPAEPMKAEDALTNG